VYPNSETYYYEVMHVLCQALMTILISQEHLPNLLVAHQLNTSPVRL